MRQKLLLNILLAFVWALVTGAVSPQNLLVGFVLGYVTIAILQPLVGTDRYGSRIFYWIRFILWFFKELFMSSIRVAIDVLTPTDRMRVTPGVIGIPLDVRTDAEITMLANTISLTPGTLSLEVSRDRKTLYIHDMYIWNKDVPHERQAIKDSVERRVQIALDTYRRREQQEGDARLTARDEAS